MRKKKKKKESDKVKEIEKGNKIMGEEGKTITKPMFLKRMTKKAWTIIGAIALIFTVVGGLYKFDIIYARASDVNMQIAAAEDRLEVQTVQTFESFQLKQKTESKLIRLKMLNMEYERLTTECKDKRRDINREPNNNMLKDELNDLIEKRSNIRAERDGLLRSVSE